MKTFLAQLKNKFFPLKAIVDTNIFVGAYWNRKSASAGILKAFEEGKIRLLYSEDIKKEVLFILRKIKVKKEFLNRVDKIFNSGRRVVVKQNLNAVLEDKSDNKYFDCAFAGKARWIISSDKHFHKVKGFKIPVVNPSRFVEDVLKA
ncbi:MAG: putative toxin-antitoxin system toxin component, PIN family [Candidatus Aureabacteria bacterium]|nr:putative toxin-antitoxin system toxin component, PIN family [Candidatus Auribacterota bacterium]